jgi:hypothetical protein
MVPDSRGSNERPYAHTCFIEVATKTIPKFTKRKYENVNVALDVKSYSILRSPTELHSIHKINEAFITVVLYAPETKKINCISSDFP